MKDKKRIFFVIGGLLIIIAGIFLAASAVNKTKQWHPDSAIKLLVDGNEKTLQEVIDGNLFTGSHMYAISSVSGGEHSAERIWVSVNGNEKTLLDALKTTGLYGNRTITSYTGPSDKSKSYHHASEIEVTICGGKISLQEAIDSSKFANYSWAIGPCSMLCSNGTANVSCNRQVDLSFIKGVPVNDSFCCNSAKPLSACNTQPCSSAASANWIKLAEGTISEAGTYRIYFYLDSAGNNHYTGATTYAQIFKNGRSLGTLRSTYYGYNKEWTEEISGWKQGDLVQVWVRVTNPESASWWPAHVTNFQYNKI